MATYEELYGKRVKEFDSDPTLDSSYEGQVWYDKSTGVLKSVVSAGAWASTSPATNGGSSSIGFGIQTAAVMAGGATGPGNQSYVEEYNGSGFSSGGALPSVRQDGGGAGTETAGVVWCGEGSTKLNTTQEYNGSSWTTTNTYPITARGVRGSGTQTAAIGCGGDTPSPAASNVSAEYDGSSWTAGNNLPGNRVAAATSGPQTSALATTGKDNTPNPSVSNLNTSYDGTSWTAQTVYPLSLRQASSMGTSSSANLVAGGVGATPFGDAVTTAAQWNGSSWTTTGSLGTKSTHMGYAGTSTAAIICRGAQDYPSYPGVAQEFNESINTITAAAFAAGNNINNARRYIRGFGIKSAGVICGGYTSSPSDKTEEFNGTTYSNSSTLGTGRYSLAACGIESAGLAFGGLNTTPSTRGETEEYDGSSWSEQTDLSTTRGELGGAGTQTAGLAFGGSTPPTVTGVTEEYNGSSWTTNPTSLNTARKGEIGGAGTQTAAVAFGGSIPPNTGATEEYDGSSWTASNAMLTARSQMSPTQNGTQSAVFAMGGSPGTNTFVENYDGTSWSTRPSLANGRRLAGGFATTSDAVLAGGYTSTNLNTTEEFTAESSAVTASTLTSS